MRDYRWAGVLIAAFLSMVCCTSGWAADKPWLVYLHATPFPSDLNQTPTSLMMELPRQAILLAAREEFGAVTRDAHCGEPLPKDQSQYAGVLEITPAVWMADRAGFRYEFKVSTPGKQPAAGEVRFIRSAPGDSYRGMISATEQFSSGEAINALKQWGLPVSKQSQLPSGANRLDEMSYFAQFQTLQHAHQALRAKPDGINELSLVSRAYANLAQLTRNHLDPTCKALAARSLLYSQRMRRKYPQESLSLATHAYTQAMSGMHVPALRDLESAKSDLPWAKATELLCNYRRTDLLALAEQDKSIRELATYMLFMTAEHEPSDSLVLQVCSNAQLISPNCFRYLDAGCEVAGVIASHTLTVAGLPMMRSALVAELPRLAPDLPELSRTPVEKIGASNDDVDFAAGAGAALVSCTAPAEPSWSMLGNMIEQTNFLHVFRRANFMAFMWSVSTNEYIADVASLYEKHPLALLIRSMQDEYRLEPRKRASFCSQMDLKVSFPASRLITTSTLEAESGGKCIGRTFGKFATLACDRVAYDQDLALREILTPQAQSIPQNQDYSKTIGKKVLEISSNNPIAVVSVMRSDPELAATHMQRWMSDLAGSPQFLKELAESHMRSKNTAAAAKVYEQYVALAPDIYVFTKLADCYSELKQDQRFLETINRALHAEDYGLGHATCQLKLAKYYELKGEHAKGIAAAELAANSWAGWAMLDCANYHELMGNWQRAELWYRRIADRYGDCQDYYGFCLRTGRGNRAKAIKDLESHTPRLMGGRPNAYFYVLQMQLAEKRFSQAVRLIRDRGDSGKYSYVAMMLAIIPDPQLGREERIAKLRAAAAATPDDDNNQPYLKNLAMEMAEAMERSRPMNTAQIESIMAETPDHERPNVLYFAGMYELLNGRQEQGKKYLQQCADAKYIQRLVVALAAEELRKRKLSPPKKLRGLWQPQATTIPATTPANPDAPW